MTAQDAFKQMMRGTVSPALRKMGFKGTATKSLGYIDGDYGTAFWTQKSVHSVKSRVYFTVHLNAWHAPSDALYWRRQLLGLIPGNREAWWAIRDSQSADSVGEEVLAAFHRYGWPAMLAALDHPGFPPAPDAHWGRTFPLPPAAGAHPPGRPDPPPWFSRPTGSEHDGIFTDIADEDPVARFSSLHLIGSEALDDPRAVPALLHSLEHDPSADVRRIAASSLRFLAAREEVRHELRLAATEDEDLDVRWEARYAIKLADLRNATAG